MCKLLFPVTLPGTGSGTLGPRSFSVQSAPKGQKEDPRPEEGWMESRTSSAPASVSAFIPPAKCVTTSDFNFEKHQVPVTAPSSTVLQTRNSSTNGAATLTDGGTKGERQRAELVARKSALLEEYKRKEAELKARYLQEMNDLGFNDQNGEEEGEGGEGGGVSTPPEAVVSAVAGE